MENTLGSRVKRAWNAFTGVRDPTVYKHDYGESYSRRPDRPRISRDNKSTITTAIYNRIALDVAAIDIRHVQLDDNGRYKEDVDSNLNECLKTAANIDQTPRSFKQDAVYSMLDEGHIAIVPVETDGDPTKDESYDICSIRVGKVTQWYPQHVKVQVYNERIGKKEEVILPKRIVTIVENPLYSVINESNSLMQRLIRKLSLLDAIDEQSGSGKLDMIIQLPYIIKTDARREQAEKRRKDIETQLSDSKYGIAYTDGTERITQLNRPLENNLMKQIEYLTTMVYGQLGITQSVMDGTADEKTMLNYTNRTVEPIIASIVEGMHRSFLTVAMRAKKQAIMYFTKPFKLVPVGEMAEIADKFTRNEIMTSNEVRQEIGMKPSNDPKADQLVNSNISQPEAGLPVDGEAVAPEEDEILKKEEENQNGEV